MADAFRSLFAEPDGDLKSVPAFLQKAMEIRAKENEDKLAKVGAVLLTMVANGRNVRLGTLRQLRASEKNAKSELANFERAAVYFEHTGNFGPLAKFLPGSQVQGFCNMLGVAYPDENDMKVPDDWVAPS